MASPNITTECTAFVAYPIEHEVGYGAESIIFEDDTSISYEDTPTKSRVIELVYENQSDSEKASFEAFFDARHGKRDIFYLNIARTGETDIKVRFDQPAVHFSSSNPRTWNWRVRVRKVT